MTATHRKGLSHAVQRGAQPIQHEPDDDEDAANADEEEEAGDEEKEARARRPVEQDGGEVDHDRRDEEQSRDERRLTPVADEPDEEDGAADDQDATADEAELQIAEQIHDVEARRRRLRRRRLGTEEAGDVSEHRQVKQDGQRRRADEAYCGALQFLDREAPGREQIEGHRYRLAEDRQNHGDMRVGAERARHREEQPGLSRPCLQSVENQLRAEQSQHEKQSVAAGVLREPDMIGRDGRQHRGRQRLEPGRDPCAHDVDERDRRDPEQDGRQAKHQRRVAAQRDADVRKHGIEHMPVVGREVGDDVDKRLADRSQRA